MSKVDRPATDKVVCWLIGHKVDADAARFAGIYDCERCGSRDGDLLVGLRLLFRRVTNRIRWVRYRLNCWIRCQDCGSRFGRHRDDCCPF